VWQCMPAIKGLIESKVLKLTLVSYQYLMFLDWILRHLSSKSVFIGCISMTMFQALKAVSDNWFSSLSHSCGPASALKPQNQLQQTSIYSGWPCLQLMSDCLWITMMSHVRSANTCAHATAFPLALLSILGSSAFPNARQACEPLSCPAFICFLSSYVCSPLPENPYASCSLVHLCPFSLSSLFPHKG